MKNLLSYGEKKSFVDDVPTDEFTSAKLQTNLEPPKPFFKGLDNQSLLIGALAGLAIYYILDND